MSLEALRKGRKSGGRVLSLPLWSDIAGDILLGYCSSRSEGSKLLEVDAVGGFIGREEVSLNVFSSGCVQLHLRSQHLKSKVTWRPLT